MRKVIFDKVKTGTAIRQKMKSRGLTVERIVADYGGDAVLIDDVLNGRKLPDLDLIIFLANILETKIDDLIIYKIV